MTLTEYTNCVLAIMNASAIDASTWPSVSTSDRYPTAHVQQIIKTVANKKLGEYALDVDSPGRGGLLTVASPTNPKSTLPARIGPISDVQVTQASGSTPAADTYRPATIDFAYAVARTVRNALGLPKEYCYGVEGETLYHTGTKATFAYVAPSSLDDPSKVLEPDELDVLAGALAVLFPFEGEQLDAGGYFFGMAQAGRQMAMGR